MTTGTGHPAVADHADGHGVADPAETVHGIRILEPPGSAARGVGQTAKDGASIVARVVGRMSAVLVLAGSTAGVGMSPVSAATLPAPPHTAVGGFSVNGNGYSLVFADGSVRPGPFGDAFSLRLPIRITARGAGAPGGGGTGRSPPTATCSATARPGRSGARVASHSTSRCSRSRRRRAAKGYLLVSRDGGVFAFGDAAFHGAAASLRLTPTHRGNLHEPDRQRLPARCPRRRHLQLRPDRVRGQPARPPRARHRRDRDGNDAERQRLLDRAQQRTGVPRSATPKPLGNGTASVVRSLHRDHRQPRLAGLPAREGLRTVRRASAPRPAAVYPAAQQRRAGTPPPGSSSRRRRSSAARRRPAYFVVDNQTGRPLSLRIARSCQPKWAVGLGKRPDTEPARVPDGMRAPVARVADRRDPALVRLRASCSRHGGVHRTSVRDCRPVNTPQVLPAGQRVPARRARRGERWLHRRSR